MSAPTDARTREQVGIALRSGDTREAVSLLRQRLLAAPGDADAMVALADLIVDEGVEEAKALLYRALMLAPAAHPIRIRLSALHQQQSQFPPALELLRQVPPELRSSFDLRVREAALCGHLGRRDEEIAIYEKLLRKESRNAPLWMSLGNALNSAGRREETVKALRKAISLNPNFGEPWWSLANLKRFSFSDNDVAAMERALGGNIAPADALHFHFALGRAYEQREDYERSFDHYRAGNLARSASLIPQQMRVTQFVDGAIETFTPALFSRYAQVGCPDEGPIFVIGLQRSGSTLIEQILASHPEVEGTSELMTMQHLWNEIGAAGARHGRDAFQEVACTDPDTFRKIGKAYLERTRSFRHEGKRFFVDKLPANWLNVGLIRLALPNAKIIDARRNPLACGFSNFKQHYATGVTFAYSLESIGLFYSDYLRMMRHFDRVQPGSILHVINERLIDDPEAEVRRMLEFVGLPFHPSCLDFHLNKRAVHTPSAQQVRQPINRDGVDYWRNYDRWLEPLRQALGPALDDWED